MTMLLTVHGKAVKPQVLLGPATDLNIYHFAMKEPFTSLRSSRLLRHHKVPFPLGILT